MMLKLSTPSAELYWLDLVPGVRIKVRPITIPSMLIARAAISKVLLDEDQSDVSERASVALVRELAQRGIVEWEGIGDAKGKPTPVTPEAIDQLLGIWQAYAAIDRLYVGPAFNLDAEKNDSSNSPAGTSAAGTPTAGTAA